MTVRNPVFDMMKGIAILLMVLGHSQIHPSLHHAIYLFHIPMFFMVSGYFFRPKEPSVCLKTDLKRLIVPYLIFATVVFLKFLVDAFRLQDFSTPLRFGKSILTGDFGIGPIWFLLALFWCREIFNAVSKWKWGALLASLASVAVAVLGLKSEFSLGFWVGVSSIIFYALGFLWAKKNVEVNLGMAVFALALSIGIFLGCGEMDVHTMLYPCYPLNVVGALSTTLFLYWFLKTVSRVAWLQKGLAFYGRWSLLLLGVHYAEFMLFDWYAKIPDTVTVAALRLAVDAGVTLGLSRIPIVKKIFF